METVFVYVWKENGELRVEEDRHTTGLFPLGTWLRLMIEAGFAVEQSSHPAEEMGETYLLIGVLKDAEGARLGASG